MSIFPKTKPFYMEQEFVNLITKPQTVTLSIETFTEVVAALGMGYGAVVGANPEDPVVKKLDAALKNLLKDMKVVDV